MFNQPAGIFNRWFAGQHPDVVAGRCGHTASTLPLTI